jgi:DNA-binding transcriptional MerR regulator
VTLEFQILASPCGDQEAELDNKSPDAFRTISEVADDLDIPQHVLRFWETRFSQIKPLKRGGGRRYYRPDDVALLKGIRRLLYGEGYTIKGLQRILKEQGPRHVQAIGRGGPVGPPPPGQTAKPAAPMATPAAAFAARPAEAGLPRDHAAHAVPDPLTVLSVILAELGECRRILQGAMQPHSESA